MPRPIWPDPIEHAFFDAWIDEAEMPDEMREERREAFTKHWGRLESGVFKRVLQEGDEADRLCALFALGYLAPAGAGNLLAPFLHSPVRKERWASAIVLGEGKDERAFPVLQELLLEHMAYFPPHGDQYANRAAFIVMLEVKERLSQSDWKQVVDPTQVQAPDEMQTYNVEYLWHAIHRSTIPTLLGAWGDSRAIPILRQALQRCWEIEQLPRFQGGVPSLFFAQPLHHLEDELAYALGQLEAWDALDGLELPQVGFQLARMYLVFGYLKVDTHSISGGDIMKFINRGEINLESVVTTLREHFGLTEYVSKGTLQRFQQWYRERAG
jgi:hypothetical protein